MAFVPLEWMLIAAVGGVEDFLIGGDFFGGIPRGDGASGVGDVIGFYGANGAHGVSHVIWVGCEEQRICRFALCCCYHYKMQGKRSSLFNGPVHGGKQEMESCALGIAIELGKEKKRFTSRSINSPVSSLLKKYQYPKVGYPSCYSVYWLSASMLKSSARGWYSMASHTRLEKRFGW